MNEDFVNVYIEVMSKKIEDLTRSEIMVQTRLNISEKLINTMQSEKQNMIEEFAKERNDIINRYEQVVATLIEEKTKLLLANEKAQASLNKKAPKVKVIDENEF